MEGGYSIVSFARLLKERCACDVVLRLRPTGSSVSLASGEQVQQVIAGGVRALCCDLGEKFGQPVPLDADVIP